MKNKAPAFQFYPADWLNDIKLQACKIASQGLMINLMCLMHQSEKYGFLLINGKKNDKKVSKIVRLTPKKFSNMVEDLVENGVLKIDGNGVYYCQRMVKDQALREIRREAGKLGGNPNLVNQKDKQSDNQKATPSSSSSSSSPKKTYGASKNEDTFDSLKEFFNQRLELDLLNKIFSAIAQTRQCNKVQESVLFNEMSKWKTRDINLVEKCMKIYIENKYYLQGKNEKYLLGIMNNEKKDADVNIINPSGQELK